MRFFLIFTKKSVAQWRQCYYDYANIKSLIVLAKKAYAIRCNIEDLARQDNYSMEENSLLVEHRDALNQIRQQKTQQISKIMQEANLLFYKYHSINKRVVFLFCQFKIHELDARLDRYNKWEDKVVTHKRQLAQLLSNCFAEHLKLQNMTQLHIEAYQKVHKKHEKAYKLFNLTTPNMRTARLARTLETLQKFQGKINKALDNHEDIIHRQTKSKFEQQIEPSPFWVSIMSYLFGLCNGFTICVIITAIVLLAINIGADSQDPQKHIKRQVFSNQYRLWKSIGFIILYIWVFGISFYIFQKERINYNLIFGYKKLAKKSANRLGTATFVSLLWSCMFIFYVLDQLNIYPAARVSENPSLPITIFFPIIIFGVFLVYILLEFIQTRRGAIFFLITLFKVVATPFGCYEITFGVIWATQQLSSLVQLEFDLAYSFCYYSRILRTPQVEDNSNPCLSFIIMVQITIIVIYFLRILQIIRIAYINKKFLWTRQMFRLIRALVQIILASLSISARDGAYGILWVWFALGIVGQLYSFAIDVLIDWNLFTIQITEDNRYEVRRREQNLYSLKIINAMVACNLICRLTYPITFSPNMMFKFVSIPQLIITIAGIIELIRRLIWNLLRVENQQIKNNYFFRVRTDYDYKQGKIMRQLCQNNPFFLLTYIALPKLQKQRGQNQLSTLRNYIRQKNSMKEKVVRFTVNSDALLENIEESAEKQIFNIVGQSN